MGVQITIRGVPERVRDELAARAALRHQSLQDFLRQQLERIAARPSTAAWLEAAGEIRSAGGAEVSASEILAARGADRR